MKKTVWLLLLASPLAFAASKVTNVEFLGTSDPHQIVVSGDGPLTFEKSENPQDKQVIVEIKDAQLVGKPAGLKLDTSSFNSKVSLVSPYQVEGQKTVRVVIQLREMTETSVAQDGNALRISVPGPETSPVADAVPGTKTPPVDAASSSDEIAAEPPVQREPHPVPKKDDKLTEFFENQATKRFIGKHITLQVRDADAADVFRLIGEASGFNIVLGDDVKGKVTLSLVDVPWDLALDTLLSSLRLGAERNNNILRIVSLANLTTEKQEQLRAKQAAEATAPRMTRIFPISYAKPSELVVLLGKFGSASASAAAAGVVPTIQVDERTNSIIVQDIPDNIERMKKLIQLLDTQTPQILIEAKVVEASENFSKNIGGSLGFGKVGSSEAHFASFNGANPVDPLIGAPGSIFETGGDVAATSANAATFGASPILSGPSFGIFNGLRLTALLNIGESENMVKIVSSPKTVVLNKQSAKIVQGTPVLVPGTTTTEQGVSIPNNTVQNANLSLSVTPTVTNDGNLMMDLNITNDVPLPVGSGLSGIGNRSITTKVVTESGATLVIGGIFNNRVTHKESGIPWLRKIPLIGHFFGSEADTTDRSELFIFITPRILNEKETGVAG